MFILILKHRENTTTIPGFTSKDRAWDTGLKLQNETMCVTFSVIEVK